MIYFEIDDKNDRVYLLGRNRRIRCSSNRKDVYVYTIQRRVKELLRDHFYELKGEGYRKWSDLYQHFLLPMKRHEKT